MAENRCQAEAPYDDQIAWCRLGRHHITRWHEGLVDSRCSECGRRDEHTQTCSAPDEPTTIEDVRWEGPREPMPEPDIWVRLGIKRYQRIWDEAEVVEVDGRPIKQVDRSKFIFDAVMGTQTLIAEFLDDAQEWGRQLERDPASVRPDEQRGSLAEDSSYAEGIR